MTKLRDKIYFTYLLIIMVLACKHRKNTKKREYFTVRGKIIRNKFYMHTQLFVLWVSESAIFIY